MSYQLGTELLNFGALLAFMGVNAAALLQAWQEGKLRLWLVQLFALGGFATCGLLWWNLGPLAKMVGTTWALFGVALWVIRRRQTHLPDAEA